jgi:hypothetical protein
MGNKMEENYLSYLKIARLLVNIGCCFVGSFVLVLLFHKINILEKILKLEHIFPYLSTIYIVLTVAASFISYVIEKI